MSEPFVNDTTSIVSVLIESARGTSEVMLRGVEIKGEDGVCAGAVHPTHGCTTRHGDT